MSAETLRLVDVLLDRGTDCDWNGIDGGLQIDDDLYLAAAELRRLHAVEQERDRLREALTNLIEAAESMRATYGVVWGDTPEDDDTYTHEKWAARFLEERTVDAIAALEQKA